MNELKVCTRCGEEKNLSGFFKDAQKKDGLCSVCKPCSNALSASWHERNKARANSNAALWYEKNKEKANKNVAAWRAKNQEKDKADRKSYQVRHPEVFRLSALNRRARKAAVGGVISKGLSAKLFKLQKGKCACCGEPLGKGFHMDHIMPLVLGGSNTDDNIQLLRQQCNNKKHTKHPVEYMQSKGFLL